MKKGHGSFLSSYCFIVYSELLQRDVIPERCENFVVVVQHHFKQFLYSKYFLIIYFLINAFISNNHFLICLFVSNNNCFNINLLIYYLFRLLLKCT